VELLRAYQNAERTQQELTLCITLGTLTDCHQGLCGSEVERTYARARDLCRRIVAHRTLFPALVGLVSFHVVRAELVDAQELGNAVSPHSTGANLRLPPVLSLLGRFSHYRGGLSQPHTHLQEGMAPMLPHAPLLARCIPRTRGRLPRAWGLSLWFLGYPDQARNGSMRR
jgi:hypothetical protein